MKLGLRFLVVVFICAGLLASAVASDAGLKSGFNSFRWGDPPLFNMDRVDRRDGMVVYFLPGDANRFAGVSTANIRYLYRNDGLCRVEVGWRKSLGSREYKTLVASLTRDWGEPEDTAGPEALRWRSEQAGTEALLQAIDSTTTPWPDYDTTMVLQASSCQ